MTSMKLPANGEGRGVGFADLRGSSLEDDEPADGRVVADAEDKPAQLRFRRLLVAPASLFLVRHGCWTPIGTSTR